MAVHEGIVARLKATAAVTALIGSGDDARLYPQSLPQRVAYPALVYEVSLSRVENDLDGEGYGDARVRLSSYAPTYTAAKELDKQVRLALHGFAHTTVGGVAIGSVSKVGGRDLLETGTEKNDVKLHRIYSDYQVWYGLATS
ncbi:MAG: DUF3168 domain-containing protein [Acidobacteriota bacterium]|nr:DUF3168 domain-containing protein [Acidobacteriota bacterium]